MRFVVVDENDADLVRAILPLRGAGLTRRDDDLILLLFHKRQYVCIDVASVPAYPRPMSASSKTAHLQIRVSAAEKNAIQRAARRAGMDMSSYVLDRLLPRSGSRFQELTTACADEADGRFALAELNSFLAGLAAGELRNAVLTAPEARLPAIQANYVAAMVEYACARRGVGAPDWTGRIAPLVSPVFGSKLESLRLYLLTHSPPPFRRRNIFVDASIGARL
jgi:uncharacterized protein (DUF1778 family)